MGIDISPKGVASLLKENSYKNVKNALSKSESWQKVSLNVGWGFYDGQNGLFASCVVDAEKNLVYVKVANTSDQPQEIVMNFSGLKKKHLLKGVECVTYHSDDPDADNTLDEPNKIIPVSQPLDFTGDVLSTSVAAKTFAVYVLAIK